MSEHYRFMVRANYGGIRGLFETREEAVAALPQCLWAGEDVNDVAIVDRGDQSRAPAVGPLVVSREEFDAMRSAGIEDRG